MSDSDSSFAEYVSSYQPTLNYDVKDSLTRIKPDDTIYRPIVRLFADKYPDSSFKFTDDGKNTTVLLKTSKFYYATSVMFSRTGYYSRYGSYNLKFTPYPDIILNFISDTRSELLHETLQNDVCADCIDIISSFA